MKKIQRLKKYFFITFILILILCGFDYVKDVFYGEKQTLWPVHHWALGFEKVPLVTLRGDIKVTSCNSVSLKPVSLKKFVRSKGVIWRHNSYYKYFNGFLNKNTRAETQKIMEAYLLSKLPCQSLVYSVFVTRKNLRTKKEDVKFIETFEYRKP